MVHRILTEAELQRRAASRRARAKRCVLWVWVIVLFGFALTAMQNTHDEPGFMPLLLSAAVALLVAVGATLFYLAGR